MKKENKVTGSNEIVIRINKEKVVNGFFTGILIVAALCFIILLGRGILKSVRVVDTEVNKELNTDLISQYYDKYLDVYYEVPGGTWGMADDSNIVTILEEVTTKSQGVDGYFDLMGEPLSEEVLSSMWLDSSDMRQYISYSFKPDLTFEDDDPNAFLTFSTEGFKFDLEESVMETETTVDYKYDLYFVEQEENGAVFMKMKVTNTYINSETGKKEDIDLYIYRYSRTFGLNALDITFGSINEDETIIPYLKHFMNSIIVNFSQEISIITDDGTNVTNSVITNTVDDEEINHEGIDETRPHVHNEDGTVTYLDESEDAEEINHEGVDETRPHVHNEDGTVTYLDESEDDEEIENTELEEEIVENSND